jgi:hypothetical protein
VIARGRPGRAVEQGGAGRSKKAHCITQLSAYFTMFKTDVPVQSSNPAFFKHFEKSGSLIADYVVIVNQYAFWSCT